MMVFFYMTGSLSCMRFGIKSTGRILRYSFMFDEFWTEMIPEHDRHLMWAVSRKQTFHRG